MSTILGESKYERKALDAYWTHKWVTEWLLNACGKLTSPGKVVWEPACGAGWISDVLSARGYDVLSTDVVDHGYANMQGLQDFMLVEEVDPTIEAIITNPPYDIENVPGVSDCTAESFLRHALKLMKPVKGKVFMLLRNEFDSASTRVDLFEGRPFSAKFVLTKRPEWIEKPQQEAKKSGPRHNYSWFGWDWSLEEDELPIIQYLRAQKEAA